MKKEVLAHFPINLGSYSLLTDQIIHAAEQGAGGAVYAANVHMLVEAYHDTRFLEAVKRAWMVTADGQPLTWALRILHGIRQERVSGMDMLPTLLAKSELKGIPVFLYGGTESLLSKAVSVIKDQFPHLTISGVLSPPFRKLTDQEEVETVKKIRDSGARLILVILGCPKQEWWMSSMAGKLKAVMIGIGGALPVFCGLQKRAPRWMQRLGMEWLYRLSQEPRRLFHRYALTNSVFMYLFVKAYLNKKIFRRNG